MSSTSRKPGQTSGSEGGSASELPTLELPARASAAGEEGRDPSSARSRTLAKLPDYDDDKVKERWKKIIDRQREEFETDVLQISKPRSKLDPIAQEALEVLCARLLRSEPQTKEASNKTITPKELEKQLRAFIVEKGIASEVKKVTQRLNARRMTDGRRWVLTETYVFLLVRLFQDKAEEIEELVDDDLGVAEKVMLDLEAENGPLDVFANLIVKAVMERNRIGKSRTLQELVAQQVRSAI